MAAVFLIADDSAGKRMLLTSFLKHAQWTVPILTATTTEEAMELIDTTEDIRWAFVDYQIPTKNGPAIIRHLKEKFPQAHVALVSAMEGRDLEDTAKAAGAEACVCTSRPEDEVMIALSDLLHRWR